METSARRVWGWGLVVLLLLAATVSAQDTPQTPPTPPAQQPASGQVQAPASDQGGADSNPLGVVLLQLRNEYYQLSNGNWEDAFIIRSDRAFLRRNRWGGKVGILTRFDLPFVTAQIGSSTHAGLGDLYGQVTHVPFLTPQFGLFWGGGLSIPSATYKTLGSGKWEVAPLGGPVYFFGRRRGLAFIKIQEFISFAGDSTRPDIRYLLVTPLVMWHFSRMTWMEFQEESHTDQLSSNSTWYKGGVKLGHMFNRKFGAWVMPEVLWGGSRPGNFNLKFSLVWNH
jgi:hypothetical protein